MKYIKLIVVLFVVVCASSVEAQDLRWSELNARGDYHFNRDEFALALEYHHRATVLARETYGLYSEKVAYSLYYQGSDNYMLGSYDEAAAGAALAGGIFEKLKMSKLKAMSDQLLARSQFQRGEVSRALKAYRDCVKYMLAHRMEMSKEAPHIIVACLYEYAAMIEESTQDREPEIIRLRSIARSIEEETK